VTDGIVMVLHFREVGDVCYIFHHGATIYAFCFVMVSCYFPSYYFLINYYTVRIVTVPKSQKQLTVWPICII